MILIVNPKIFEIFWIKYDYSRDLSPISFQKLSKFRQID